MVECLDNPLSHGLGITHHIVVPESQDSVASCCQSVIAATVALAVCVLPAVDLDNQSGCKAREVDDIWADAVLPAKMNAERMASDDTPEPPLRVCLVATEMAGQSGVSHPAMVAVLGQTNTPSLPSPAIAGEGPVAVTLCSEELLQRPQRLGRGFLGQEVAALDGVALHVTGLGAPGGEDVVGAADQAAAAPEHQ